MAERYFICRPNELCERAACCRSLETRPTLGVGDYIRLSEYTGEPVTKIWRERGNINLTHFKGMGTGEFIATLSLLHDPCPYLSDDSACSVYEVRPLVCADFPFNLLIEERERLEQYKDYDCLRDVRPTPRQVKKWKELKGIMNREADLDCKFFWRGRPTVTISTIGAYFELVKRAIDLQKVRDPEAKSERSRRLLESSSKMKDLLETGELQNGLQADLYISLITPALFPVIEEQVAWELARMDERTEELYRETSEKWKRLAREMG
jgi:Fe-S-cluster containining protein